QAAAAHDFLCHPFRFVVRRAAVRTGAQKTDENDLARARLLGRRDDISCALDMDSPERLPAQITVDPSAMDNCFATGKCFCELANIIKPDGIKAGSGKLVPGCDGAVAATANNHQFMALRGQRARDMASDKTSSSSYGDSHN